jgi:hypothetical protein
VFQVSSESRRAAAAGCGAGVETYHLRYFLTGNHRIGKSLPSSLRKKKLKNTKRDVMMVAIRFFRRWGVRGGMS